MPICTCQFCYGRDQPLEWFSVNLRTGKRYKTCDKNRDYSREYYQENKSKKREYHRRYSVEYRKKPKSREYRRRYLEGQREYQRKLRQKHRHLVIAHLSNNEMRCANCGLPLYEVLQVDHVNNDGYGHRKRIGGGGCVLYSWLIKNDFPDELDYQILCANCNYFKEIKGRLPTKQEIIETYKDSIMFLENI
jgi:hypothetical protein